MAVPILSNWQPHLDAVVSYSSFCMVCTHPERGVQSGGPHRGLVCADPAAMSSPAPGSMDIIAYEQRAGLRSEDDMLPDKERRQQVCFWVSLQPKLS